jgi:hypothetical protein
VTRGLTLAGWAALGLVLLGWWPGKGIAMTSLARQGFSVSPAYGELSVPDDKPQMSYSVKLTNSNATDQLFSLSTVDFGSLDENGGVAFLGVQTSELEHKYGLASWMQLPQTSMQVPAGKTVEVPVVIDNRPSLAPGGHYGAVLATALTAGSGAKNSVGIKQVLSSLLLVTKQGGLRQHLGLVAQTSDASWWRLPGRVTQRFQNTGNVHLVPRGVVSVKDPFGKEVERTAINEDSKIVLPDSFRRLNSTLIPVGKGWMPGRYTLVASYRYDGTDSTTLVVQRFWYAGMALVWLVVALAVLAAAGLAWWLWSRPKRRRQRR